MDAAGSEMLSLSSQCFSSQHEPSAATFLNFRQNEQTCPPGVHVQMSTPVKLIQASIKAELLDTNAAASLSLGPMVDSVSPSRAQTDVVLPQSSKSFTSLCGFHSVVPHFLCENTGFYFFKHILININVRKF